jgi:hypothetical protein
MLAESGDWAERIGRALGIGCVIGRLSGDTWFERMSTLPPSFSQQVALVCVAPHAQVRHASDARDFACELGRGVIGFEAGPLARALRREAFG